MLNSSLADLNPVTGAAKTIWNRSEQRRIRELVRETHPDVAHFHNTFPSISPAGYYAVKAEGVPVVQSLHNYRFFCINSFCFRDGAPCEDCRGKFFPYPGIVHSCHPRGRAVSTSVATMLSFHRMLRTWQRMVDVYINAATNFARDRLTEGGVPAEKIVTKPNFLDPDPGFREGGGGYALFVGRISPEKGIETLLRAWEHVPEHISLRILGDGPLAPAVQAAAESRPNIEWLGRRPLEDVIEAMGNAKALIFPSEWYEGMPRTIIESLAVGTPLIISDMGGLPEMVTHGCSGLIFPSGNVEALAERVTEFFSPATDHAAFRSGARQDFERRFTADENYRQLTAIYERAIRVARTEQA